MPATVGHGLFRCGKGHQSLAARRHWSNGVTIVLLRGSGAITGTNVTGSRAVPMVMLAALCHCGHHELP
jgi:hypothetical protein